MLDFERSRIRSLTVAARQESAIRQETAHRGATVRQRSGNRNRWFQVRANLPYKNGIAVKEQDYRWN